MLEEDNAGIDDLLWDPCL